MVTFTGNNLAVLVGPTCPACASDDLRWGAPLGALRQGECRNCGTEYRWYAQPQPEPICPGCGIPHDERHAGDVFCEDCEPADCKYCGAQTARAMLSANHACVVCERGEVA